MKQFITILMIFMGVQAWADQPTLSFRSGFDYFQLEQSSITGLNGMSVFYETPGGYYVGESIYSAALGNGGGFFVGGIEAGRHATFGENLFWDASLFIGGGGGANQVPGDGLMLRSQLHLGYEFEQFRIGAGASWVSVSGSEISTPAFTLVLTRPLDLALQSGEEFVPSINGATRVSALKPLARVYFPQSSRKRGGAPLEAMQLVGAEVSFMRRANSESFIQASGVVRGDAEGYADWILGKRYFMGTNGLRVFADFGAGVGGGGAVDTGGGLIASLGAGLRIEAYERLALELGVSGISALNGDFLVISPSVKLALSFGASDENIPPNKTRWQISTGLTQQFPNGGFRKPTAPNTGAPLMIDTSIDLYVSDDIYLTGHAYTALAGGAGGYQIGLIGVGYRLPISLRVDLSGELMLGAGGGAGVDTRGGLLAAYKLELDYHLTDQLYLTGGVGQVRTIEEGGMQPLTMNLGIKIPFTTQH